MYEINELNHANNSCPDELTYRNHFSMEAEIFPPVSTNCPDQSYLQNAATATVVALHDNRHTHGRDIESGCTRWYNMNWTISLIKYFSRFDPKECYRFSDQSSWFSKIRNMNMKLHISLVIIWRFKMKEESMVIITEILGVDFGFAYRL